MIGFVVELALCFVEAVLYHDVDLLEDFEGEYVVDFVLGSAVVEFIAPLLDEFDVETPDGLGVEVVVVEEEGLVHAEDGFVLLVLGVQGRVGHLLGLVLVGDSGLLLLDEPSNELWL